MLRFKVAKEAFSRKAVPVNEPKERPSEYFGKYVFNREKMFKYLPKKTYEAVIEAIDNSTPLSREVAGFVLCVCFPYGLPPNILPAVIL